MFDELKILITGDTSGIESAVKKALNIVQGGVEKMNDETVDWTGIFSRAVSPAIISGVASMFAFAIAQSVQFQQSMNTTGTAAGDTSAQISQLGQQAIGLSQILPSSAQDLANSMTQVSAIFGTNTQATQNITQAISELSASGFGNLNDITSSAITLFRQFGVTTESQAVQVLTDLMHAAQGAKESIPTLTDQFSQFASQLPQSDRNINSINGQLATFAATIAQIGPDATKAIFDALASSSASAGGPLEQVGIGFQTINKALTTGNLTGLLSQAVDDIQKLPTTGAVAIIGQPALAAFTTLADRLPQVRDDTKTIATNSQSIAAAFQLSDSALRDFMTDWNKLQALFTSGPLAATIQGLAKVFGGIIDAIQSTGGFLSGVATNPVGFLGLNPSQLLSFLTGGGGPNNGALSKQLSGTGLNFTSGALSRLDQTAGSQSMIDSLVSALQTGIKGNQYTSLVSTFNLTVPPGSAGLTAKQIAQQLYTQFQGTQ